MKKFLLISLLLGAIGLSATNVSAKQEDLTQELSNTNENMGEQISSKVERIQIRYFNGEDVSKDLEELKVELPLLINENKIEVGNNVDDVCNWIELIKANKDAESLQECIENIDVNEYMPLSNEELEALINK